MSDFRFAEPQWVHALWVVLVAVAGLFWLEARGGSALATLVSSHLQSRLVQRPGSLQRRLSIGLIGLACVWLVVALMRPQWGLHYVAATRVGADIMICVDVSKSMWAEDVAPNRLERAKAEIRDLLPYLEGDRIGLIAFAGRASVLSPLTPDFSFLRLVLDGMGPHSVSRGGTRLEEPIRKAVVGFSAGADRSQAIILITDGEDHDSFPLEAAKAAAEIGVRIIAIGFGDEAGSEIVITDRDTGARRVLRDASGQPVRSRLDGETLRQIALATSGAYVPAGTGILDLESIYASHIAPLKRGASESRGKPVRHEGYQWAILLALISLALGAGLTSRAPTAQLLNPIMRGLPLLLVAFSLGSSGVSAATASESSQPRELYNQGLSALENDGFETAELKFEEARTAAGEDGEVRYRAAYNLGITAAKSAQASEAEPRQALARLQVAADWFREAVRLRPDESEPRHNLEVVLNQAMALADALAQRDPNDWAAELETLAEQERGLLGDLRGGVERVAAQEQPHLDEPLRRELHGFAAQQRTVLSDADALASRIGDARDGLRNRSEEERSPEDNVRLVQLENLLHYLHRARERMGQARGRLRDRQPERAYRRASAALAELRRAQDQLRNPVEVLDAILPEAYEVARGTAALAVSSLQVMNDPVSPKPPAWLTPEFLREGQDTVQGRTAELATRLAAGLNGEAESDPQAAAFMERVGRAHPSVERGAEAFARAQQALQEDQLGVANEAQAEAILALLDAREQFLDLRRLIELTYQDERSIHQVLDADEAEREAPLAELLPRLKDLQTKNLERSKRIEGSLQAAATAPPATEDPQAAELEAQRNARAQQLLVSAREAMQKAEKKLVQSGASAVAPVAEATERLAELRRLYFSIVEHLRDTARRQIELGDQTQDAAARAATEPEDLLGPLVPRQRELAEVAAQLAQALEEQSRTVATPDPNAPAVDPAQVMEQGEKLRRAGEEVLGAEQSMQTAAGQIQQDPPAFDSAQEQQREAVQQLARAIALLSPPQRQPQDPQDSDQQQQQQQQQQGASGERGEEEPETPSADPAQLLQAVRDREAQRQRERAERQHSGYETVEKDW